MRSSVSSGVVRPLLKILVITTLLFPLLSPAQAAESHDSGRALGFWSVLAFPRYWISLIFGLAGLLLLAKAHFTRDLRLALLPIIFFVFSVVAALPLGTFARRMGLHPSPVCTVTKPFLFIEAGEAVPAVFWVSLGVVAFLTVLGNKLFCGWVCPIGALQELIHRIPLPKRLRGRIPFRAANTIRITIFVIFVIVAFAAGVEIYEYFNPFEALHWTFETAGLIVVGATSIAALFVWRPFCYLVCPLGLVTWVLEQFSVFRIRVDRNLCRDCDRCIDRSPCLAMPAIVEGSRIRPDCFACGLCLDQCRKKGLRYGGPLPLEGTVDR